MRCEIVIIKASLSTVFFLWNVERMAAWWSFPPALKYSVTSTGGWNLLLQQKDRKHTALLIKLQWGNSLFMGDGDGVPGIRGRWRSGDRSQRAPWHIGRKIDWQQTKTFIKLHKWLFNDRNMNKELSWTAQLVQWNVTSSQPYRCCLAILTDRTMETWDKVGNAPGKYDSITQKYCKPMPGIIYHTSCL